jgi:hypothetical protein
MKIVYKFLFIIILSVLVVSCEEESNLQPEGLWELSNPQLELPASNQSFVLDQITPNETITFSWQPATSSEDFAVTYKVSIHETSDTEFANPLYQFASGNAGKALSATISYQKIDEILSFAGFPANEEATISWAVIAESLSKTSLTSNTITVKRFEDEITPNRLFISGTASEDDGVLENAMQLTRLTDANGNLSNVHEVYTQLKAGETYQFYSENTLPSLQYGGENGTLEKSGNAIVAEDDGVFRIKVDLDNNTYELFKIDFFSMVGSPINGGWGGDESLTYQGNGIWSESIDLISTGGFAFRANGDWGYLMKRVVGSQNTIVFENEATSQGVTVEDIPSNEAGFFKVTLNLNAESYSFTLERDNTILNPIDAPASLFLLEDGNMIKEFTKNGDVFELNEFIAMQSSASYTLNSSADGSGQNYSLATNLAESNTPEGDKVTDTVLILEDNSNPFVLSSDRALQLSFDFNAAKVTWTYYNIKLFHWSVWDERDEFPMTYEHPNTFKITTNIISNYDMKFISPWDFDFGSDAPNSINGNLINTGGENIKNITEDGSYEVTIVLDNSYETGTYQFVKQ